jgi:hypothetical protein
MLGIEERDRNLSEDVNDNYLNVQNAGFYYKCKIDKRHFRAVRSAAHEARVYHREVTVPWDRIWRLLPASLSLEYTNKMSSFKIGFENAVNDLKNTWPAIIAAEQARLKSKLFNPADYPNQADLLNYFSFAHTINPVPDSSHLILDIEASVMQELRDTLDKENAVRIGDAKKDMYVRLLTPVAHMADICSNDKRVYDTMVQDVKNVTILLSELSAASLGDTALAEQLATVKSKLAGFTPGQIRNDPRLKAKLGQEAAIIASQIHASLNNGGTAPPVV